MACSPVRMRVRVGLPLSEHLSWDNFALSRDRLSRGFCQGRVFVVVAPQDIDPLGWQTGRRLDGLHRPRGRAGAEGRVYVDVTGASGKDDVSGARGAECLRESLVRGLRMRLRLHISCRVVRCVPGHTSGVPLP